jgi:hypothetical protein
MSRKTRDAKIRLRLKIAEEGFRAVLTSSLRKCEDGSLGVFLTEAKATRLGDVYPRLVWPEAKRLESLGKEINLLRGELGEPMEGTLYTRYQEYCTRDRPNEVGGKKMAAQLLAEIERRGEE